MSARLFWSSETCSSTFKFNSRFLHLIVQKDRLDCISTAPENRDGISIENKNGVYTLRAFGECEFEHNEDYFSTINISSDEKLLLNSEESTFEISIKEESTIKDPLIGEVLDGHKIIERLGSGGVGIVYKASQTALDREVALKVLNTKAAKDSKTVDAFKREAIAAGQLSHPNLVQVFNVGFDKGLHFFTMELVDGGDLEEQLKHFGPLSEPEALDATIQVAEALEYASTQGLIHRDIKPENMMITSDGRVKLADLGMAATREALDQAGVGGTPHFMAPEVISTPHNLDDRCDYYSLGCSLFRLLTGETPYQGSSVKEILLAHRQDEIPVLEGINKKTQALLFTLMSKDVEDRPNSAREIIQECELILQPQKSKLLIPALLILLISSAYFLTEKTPEPQTTIIVDDTAAETQRKKNEALEQSLAAQQEEIERLKQEAQKEKAPANDQGNQLEKEKIEEEKLTITIANIEKMILAGNMAEAINIAEKHNGDAAQKEQLLSETKIKVDNTFNEKYSIYRDFLTQQQWQKAALAIEEMVELFSNIDIYDKRLKESLKELKSAEEANLRFLTRKNRTEYHEYQYEKICLPLSDFMFSTALEVAKNESLQQAPKEYREYISQLKEHLLLAKKGKEKIINAIFNNIDLDIIEPRNNKRGFLQSANEKEIVLTIQSRGERIPQKYFWGEFLTPDLYFDFIKSIGLKAEDPEIQSIVFLQLVAQTAKDLKSIYKESGTATIASENVTRWLEAFSSLKLSPLLSNEYQSLILAQSTLRKIVDGEFYAAMQFMDELIKKMSLLTIWASEGQEPFSS